MRLNAALGCSSSAALLFDSPSIAQIANELAGQAGMFSGNLSEAMVAIPKAPLSPEERQAGLPCSFNQEQMIAISLQPSGLAYNQYFVFELAGMVNAQLIQESLDVLVSRHEALRTCFHMTPAGPKQVVQPAGDTLPPLNSSSRACGIKCCSSHCLACPHVARPGSFIQWHHCLLMRHALDWLSAPGNILFKYPQ